MSAQETRGLTLNGTDELVREGVRALEALKDYLEQRGTMYPADGISDLAELRLYENTPIEAVICDDIGSATIVWTGEEWKEREQ